MGMIFPMSSRGKKKIFRFQLRPWGWRRDVHFALSRSRFFGSMETSRGGKGLIRIYWFGKRKGARGKGRGGEGRRRSEFHKNPCIQVLCRSTVLVERRRELLVSQRPRTKLVAVDQTKDGHIHMGETDLNKCSISQRISRTGFDDQKKTVRP